MASTREWLKEDGKFVKPSYTSFTTRCYFFLKNVSRRLVGIGSLLLAWQLLAIIGLINPQLLPPPSELVGALWRLSNDGSLLANTVASLQRVLVGFALAAVVGIALGIVLGWWRGASEICKPVIEALRPIPPIAWTPMAILWFGVGNGPSYFIVFTGALFPVFVNTYSAVQGISRTQINAALCLGARPMLLFTDVILPASLPFIFPGLRIALGIGWMCVVAAELIAAQSGLGYMIQQSRMLLQTQDVLSGMVVIGVIGFVMNTGMVWLEHWLIPWTTARSR